jgi:adenylate cyclase
MAKQHLSRKLAVILHADVVGSTMLVQQNETLAHERIQATFHNFSETIKSYGGITRELRGDALVAEFDRASDAISAALAYQVLNIETNSKLNDDILPLLRIGISLGEVVIADNTITGAGVVLAQRLEQLSEPGGVCIQGAAYETVPQRFPFEYKNLGEQKLKGFEMLVQAYAITLKPDEKIPAPEPIEKAIATVLNQLPRTAPQDNKSSIFIMPFHNNSNDRGQDYVAKGITDNIIIALTRFRELFVFAYKTSAAADGIIDTPISAYKQLGANYVVEGSVQRSPDRIRVSARMVDARENQHLWAQNYDRNPDDIISIQDEIAELIASSLVDTVEKIDGKRAQKFSNAQLATYDLVLKGRVFLNEYTQEGEIAARECFQKAIDLDSNYAPAYAGMAVSFDHEYYETWCKDPEQANARAYEFACKAVKLDDTNIMGLYALAEVYYLRGEHERAVIEIDRAIENNPNDYHNICSKGEYLTFSGQFQAGMRCSLEAMSANPLAADNCLRVIGVGEYLSGNFDLALIAFSKVKRNSLFKLGSIAACYAQLGRTAEATRICEEFFTLAGGADAEIENWKDYWSRTCPFSDPGDREKILSGMQKAGIPVNIES